MVLNDRIADGRDISWIWDADFETLAPRAGRVVCSGTRAEELALRFKYAGVGQRRLEVIPSLERGFDRALAGGERRAGALRPPTYTALLELRDVLADRGYAPPFWESERARLARHGVRVLRRRPALWDELAGAARAARRARPGVRHGPGVDPARAPRHRVTGVDLEPAFLEEAGARAGVEGGRRDGGRGRALVRPRPPFDLVLAPMQLVQLFGGSEERMAMLKAVAAHLRAGGLFAAALMDLEGEDMGDDYVPPGPDMRDVNGWVYSSQPVAVRSLDGGRRSRSTACAPSSHPSGERTSTRRRSASSCSPPPVRAGGRGGGLTARAQVIPPTEDHVGSVVGAGDRAMTARNAASHVALSGPHEHLRGPREYRVPRAPLRVARHRVRARAPRARRAASTPTRTTSSTSAADRTATRHWSRRTWWRASARRWPPRWTGGARCWRCAAATSCSATPTRWAASPSPGSDWSTCARCASRASA